jgi:hypothetical protein
VDFGFVLRNGGWESINGSGKKDGKKYVIQRRRIAEKVEVDGYPELQPTHLCQGQTYVHARTKWNVGSADVAGGEDDIEDQLEDELELEHRNEEDNAWDNIVVLPAGRSKDDVSTDTQNPSP